MLQETEDGTSIMANKGKYMSRNLVYLTGNCNS